MWDDPAALNRLSATLLAATLLFALWLAGRQAAEAWLPVRVVEVHGARHAETRQGIAPLLAGQTGGLLAADLAALRRGFEALPWVRSAAVRRVWPDRLAVELEEHIPAAAWNDLAVLDTHGEVFPVRPWPGLPRVHAPEGVEKEVAARHSAFARLLAEHGLAIAALRVDARHAWRIELSDGVGVELGRERLDERLQRFVTFYPLLQARVAAIRRVDMRYPNGFAVQGEARS
ncbi:MAG: cell division protein FtsQ/DivIB [Gallionellaceae bacterium]|nr:cell division protein FtsQ/DivIB [Gallionellaceae bacterium]